jgi:archaemetzincin
VIALWWIGTARMDEDAMEQARQHLQGHFESEVALQVRPGRPQDAWDPQRRQWSSSRLVGWLAGQAPQWASRVLGVVDEDLFIPVLSYVFGEAQLGGRAAVVSTARLAAAPTEGAGWRALFSRGADPRELFLTRLMKECAHELGHTFGLVHCADRTCLMSRSPSISHVDVKGRELCPRCRHRLHSGPAFGELR